MADGDVLQPVILFNLLGLTPGASYAGSFSLIEGFSVLATQEFSFVAPTESATPVPEPTSILLVGSGVWFAWRKGRRKSLRADGR